MLENFNLLEFPEASLRSGLFHIITAVDAIKYFLMLIIRCGEWRNININTFHCLSESDHSLLLLNSTGCVFWHPWGPSSAVQAVVCLSKLPWAALHTLHVAALSLLQSEASSLEPRPIRDESWCVARGGPVGRVASLWDRHQLQGLREACGETRSPGCSLLPWALPH